VNAPVVTETRERFIAAIAEQIPPERIAEIHFFQGITQSGIESGVAVIAAIRPGAPEDDLAKPERFTVYTAHYRLVRKGPDRGKWETIVVDEADAPLVTVDSVVRGVQRRSGDADDPERMDGDDARAILARLSAKS
jgi:hypothetical protein